MREISVAVRIWPGDVARDPARSGTQHTFGVGMSTGPMLGLLDPPIFVSDDEVWSEEHRARLALDRVTVLLRTALDEDVRRKLLGLRG